MKNRFGIGIQLRSLRAEPPSQPLRRFPVIVLITMALVALGQGR